MDQKSSGSEHMSSWVAGAPSKVDLTRPDQDAWTRRVAGEMLERFAREGELQDLEERYQDVPILVRLAMKLAQSKQRVMSLPDEVHVSIVFAVYKEHHRLRTRAEHPHGEDFLVRKVDQLNWLFDGSPRVTWSMLVVDDGCPEKSGEIARQIIDAWNLGERVRVLFLQNAIDVGHPAAKGIASTADSQKGGSIEYGMAVASDEDYAKHVVVFTDADLSTHLGQLGLLIEPIVGQGFDAAIGSRREPLSVVIKGGARNARGKLFIYLWKRLIPQLSPIIDTQCGFKAFRASVAQAIVKDTIEKRFAFDIELLLRTQLARQGSIVKMPIAWIDSEAASTTTELQPYLAMLQSIVRIAQRYLPQSEQASSFSRLIESLDEESWARLASHVPPLIAEREPMELEAFDGVTAGVLAQVARGGGVSL